MWIKREKRDAVNLDFVKCIKKCIREEYDDYGPIYRIDFNFNHGEINYHFETKEELNDYYEALMNFIGAQEIPTLKI